MIRFTSEKVSDSTTRIRGIVNEQMYLVEGKERAALLDTGSGVGDLKAFVETLTDRSVTVLLTHGHVDHASGAVQFSDVYMNPLDRVVFMNHRSKEMRSAYLATSPRFGEVEDQDYLPNGDPDQFHPVKNGDMFDLGGLTIEAFACGGHTPGCMMYLIREEEALLSGDACNFFTMLQDTAFSLKITEYEKNLACVREQLKGKYRTIFLSHGNVIPPNSLLDEVLDVCEEIREGTDDKIPYDFLGSHGFVAKAYGQGYMRTDGKTGNIVYSPERI
ncbi:MAG: MBL fold metallo-hydrolase [Lachnospiraceae bacterium]|nr:MBL fold metallo-hydrolase [Lachnospiraceae bacterium]